MAFITQSTIDAIKNSFTPRAVPKFNDLVQKHIAAYRAMVPSWQGYDKPADLQYKQLEYLAHVEIQHIIQQNALWLLNHLPFTTDKEVARLAGIEDLTKLVDLVALRYSLVRLDGETNEHLLNRAINRFSSVSPDVINGILDRARESTNPRVNDVATAEIVDTRNVDVYFNIAPLEIPNREEIRLLQAHLDLAINDPIGRTITVKAPEIYDYDLAVVADYRVTAVDRLVIKEQIEKNLVAYTTEHAKLKEEVNKAGIHHYVYSENATIDVSLSQIIDKELESSLVGAVAITETDFVFKVDDPSITVEIEAPPDPTDTQATGTVITHINPLDSDQKAVVGVKVTNRGTGYIQNPVVKFYSVVDGIKTETTSVVGRAILGKIVEQLPENAGRMYRNLPENRSVLMKSV